MGERYPEARLLLVGDYERGDPVADETARRLEAHARVAGRLGGMIKIEGEITADGRIVGTGSLTLAG